VWRADLTQVDDEVCGLLCDQERARAERILRELDRQLWRRSRGLLRALLGRYLQEDPRVLRFSVGSHGKPALTADAIDSKPTPRRSSIEPARFSFNMAHSGRLALYAFSESGAVGVDVEVARREIDEVAIAGRVFGSARARCLEGLDPAVRRQEFLRMWACHEAELKCLGVGIGRADLANETRRPWIAELEPGPGAAGAVATERPARELCCWDWWPSSQ